MKEIITGDSFELIKDLPDNSVDLVITSPPYTNIISYGDKVSVKKPSDYVDWILPLFKEIHRVLKPSGSFILNIGDTCDGGYRNTYIFELIHRNSKETPLKLYDYYTWIKPNSIPNGSSKRFRNTSEFIFHFCKDRKQMKFYMDRVLEDMKETSEKRYKSPIDNNDVIIDGKRKTEKVVWVRRTNMKVDSNGIKDPDLVQRIVPDKVRPNNIFRFPTASAARDNIIRHPAPFHKDLPCYFINLLTDEGDTILDVFAGIGTTGLCCENRNFIGFEMNPEYAEFAKKRIDGNNGEKYVINQYDMEDNFIASFDGITNACNSIGYSTPHNIMMCYRGFRNEAGGYKWKLEKQDGN